MQDFISHLDGQYIKNTKENYLELKKQIVMPKKNGVNIVRS